MKKTITEKIQKPIAIELSDAVAHAVKQCEVDVITSYPITPQTLILEKLSKLKANGKLKAEFVNVESEHSSLSAAIGASASGSRVFSSTSSQGLLYMAEMLPIASGLRLPIVMVNANRAISAPINIWCFSKEAKILMKDLSYKQISEVKIGDDVLGKDSRGNLVFTKVKNTFKRKVENLVKVKTEKFDLFCTSEHKFYYHPTHDHWTTAKSLKNKNLHWFGYGFNEDEQFKKGWLSGVSDGDGCFFRDKKNRFSFRLKVKDEEIVKKFVEWSRELGFNMREVDYHKKRGFFMAICTKNKESERLKKFLEKKEEYDFCRGYLAGIFDAEGSGPFKIKQVVIYNSNPSIIKYVSKILKILNISFKVYSDKRRGGFRIRDNYHIKINNVPEFFVKCRPVLERKRNNILQMTLKSVKSKIKVLDVIDINKEMEVYNIETESKNYIVNGLLVHNCDHSDSMFVKDGCWIQLYCESVQETYDTIIQAYKIAENKNIQLPVMICIDGFYLSHVMENAELLEDRKVKAFVRNFIPQKKLDCKKPITLGHVASPEHYYKFKEQQEKAMNYSIDEIKKINSEFAEKFKRKYGDGLIEEYNLGNAETVFIALGSLCSTIKGAIIEKNDKKIGLIRIKSFRPFPKKEMTKLLNKKIKRIIVIDRSLAFGTDNPVYSEIKKLPLNKEIKMKNFVLGLGGKNVTEEELFGIINHFDSFKEVNIL